MEHYQTSIMVLALFFMHGTVILHWFFGTCPMVQQWSSLNTMVCEYFHVHLVQWYYILITLSEGYSSFQTTPLLSSFFVSNVFSYSFSTCFVLLGHHGRTITDKWESWSWGGAEVSLFLLWTHEDEKKPYIIIFFFPNPRSMNGIRDCKTSIWDRISCPNLTFLTW